MTDTIKPGMTVLLPGGETGWIRSLLVRDANDKVMAEVVVNDNQKCHAVRFVYPRDLIEVKA